MALNPGTINLLVQQIQNSQPQMFRSLVSQLFNYLASEIKDNPIYDIYEQGSVKWSDQPVDNNALYSDFIDWDFPDNLEDAKSLSYEIYKRISKESNAWVSNFAISLFHDRHIVDNYEKLNSAFITNFQQALQDIVNANPEIEDSSPRKTNKTTVFIIHGHDNELKMEVKLLLQKAGLNNIVLHEKTDKGRTIIDKLIAETEPAGYAIALLSPDDLTTDGNNRARQKCNIRNRLLFRVSRERKAKNGSKRTS